MARSKNRRRRYSSNQRLPTVRSSYTSRRSYPSLLSNYDIDPFEGAATILQLRRALGLLPKRQLAKTQKSTFPKTYGVRAPIQQKNVKAVATADRVTLPVCASRAIREEVMHAIGKSGKRGQKSPIWTKKSKVRC